MSSERVAVASPRTIIVHNHVFKNAGTTIDWALRRNFGDGFVDHRDDAEMVRGAAYLGSYLADRPEIVALSTHHLRPPLPVMPGANLMTLMMLRHPIERVTSVYRFERSQVDATTLGAVYARDHTLQEYVRWRMRDDVPPTIRNFHIHRTLPPPADWRRPVSDHEQLLARLYVETTPLLGLVERFDESMVWFEHVLRPWFPQIDLAYVMQNVGQPRAERSARLDRLRDEIGDEVYERLVATNEPDLALFDHGVAEFERRLASLPDLDARLTDFRERCRLLSEPAPPLSAPLPPTPIPAPLTFDEAELDPGQRAELDQLAGLARKHRFAPPLVQLALQKRGFQIEQAHFYSPVPTIEDITQAFEYAQDMPFAVEGMFDDASLRRNIAVLARHAQGFDPPKEGRADDPAGYFWSNGLFSFSDAMSYYAMIRLRRPRTVLEIGSGFSTLVAAQAVADNGSGRIICVEPFPRPWLSRLPGVELVQRRAQSLQADEVNGWLGDGDLLFIDSTHSVKIGSDCLHLYLRLLPRLAHDLHIHVHDVFLPWGMPRDWALQQHIYWTEQYLLLAYLIGNPRCATVFASHYGHLRLPADMEALMHGRHPHGGGSFWFHQAAPGAQGRRRL